MIAPATPRYFPATTAARGTGLLTTVSTVLFSISRVSTPVAVNAARSSPARKSVLSPRSMSSLLSSSSVKAAKLTLSTIARMPAMRSTANTGWRIDSRNALRATTRAVMRELYPPSGSLMDFSHDSRLALTRSE
ncbi:MAG: hypothetical protein EBX35_12290 [Planctomycetia bacterium]|nr:hypothetical protein [Planctomycetia bacterium]